MIPENLGSGSGVNHEGDVVPIEEVSAELGHTPMRNTAIIEAAKRLFDEEDVVASNVRIDHDGRHRIYPKTVEEVLAVRRNTPPAEERYDAFAELGGGLRSYRDGEPVIPLENAISDEYRPWQVDIRAAVEQFGLVEFSPNLFKTMKPDDYAIFCEQFYEYQQKVIRHKQLIEDVKGDRRVNPELTDIFGAQSSEDLMKYANTLGYLMKDLEKLGIPRGVRNELGAPEHPGENAHRRSSLLHEATQRRKRHHGKVVQVVRTKDKLAIEWHEK